MSIEYILYKWNIMLQCKVVVKRWEVGKGYIETDDQTIYMVHLIWHPNLSMWDENVNNNDKTK